MQTIKCGILYQWKENYEGVLDFRPNPTAESAPVLTSTASIHLQNLSFFDLQGSQGKLVCQKMQLYLVN